MLYTLIKSSEEKVRELVIRELKTLGYEPIVDDNFIFAQGTEPYLLCAHYDTVLSKPPKYVANRKGILSAKHGLGADDRAGIFAVLQLIKTHHCSCLFTGGEERGGIGAGAFVKSGIPLDVNYIIELDRRGTNDAVYYQCDNPDFEEFISSFGWVTAYGSYTDICELAPHLGVAAVNLSIGYSNEHHENETLDINVMNRNINRVSEMLSGEKFKWIEEEHFSSYRSSSYLDYFSDVLITYIDEDGHYKDQLIPMVTTLEEAIGTFLMEHPHLTFNNVIDYSEEDFIY